MRSFRIYVRVILVCVAALVAGCAVPNDSSQQSRSPEVRRSSEGGITDALIYSGAGSWPPEVESLSQILATRGASYERGDSDRLNSMTLEEFTRFRALVFPGGNSYSIAAALGAETLERIRTAIQEKGVRFIGFCAGAWLVGPTGLGMVAGSAQSESWMGRQGRHFALDLAQLENGVRRELLWYGGPSTPEISGGVVAKYSDGSPAITQIQSGQGFLIVSGFHPGATAAILASLGLRRDAYDHDFAWTLLKAAITGQKLKALQ